MHETNFTAFAQEVHENAVAHGWWDEPRTVPEILMLCVSELSEGLEEYRDNKPLIYTACPGLPLCAEDEAAPSCNDCPPPKPEGLAIELADCIIRILDYCGHAGIDIGAAIHMKHEYNKTRPYRHGGKRI